MTISRLLLPGTIPLQQLRKVCSQACFRGMQVQQMKFTPIKRPALFPQQNTRLSLSARFYATQIKKPLNNNVYAEALAQNIGKTPEETVGTFAIKLYDRTNNIAQTMTYVRQLVSNDLKDPAEENRVVIAACKSLSQHLMNRASKDNDKARAFQSFKRAKLCIELLRTCCEYEATLMAQKSAIKELELFGKFQINTQD